MRLKDLEKIKLIETALMLGVPLGLSMFNHNPIEQRLIVLKGEAITQNGK